jgi:hypothetical protein
MLQSSQSLKAKVTRVGHPAPMPQQVPVLWHQRPEAVSSSNHHFSGAKLLNLLSSCIPKQLPNNFRICRLLQDIILKITTWLCNLPPWTDTKGTTVKQACFWGYWTKYLKAIELNNDPFLTRCS